MSRVRGQANGAGDAGINARFPESCVVHLPSHAYARLPWRQPKEVRSATSEPESPRMGHNSRGITPGVPINATVFEQFEAIIDCQDYSAEQKCILVKIRCRVNSKTMDGAIVSNEGLMRATSLKDPRALRAELRDLQGKARMLPEGRDAKGRPIDDPIEDSRVTIVIDQRGGKASVIGFTPERLRAIVAAYLQYREEKRGPGRPWPTKPPASDAPPLSDKPPASHTGGLNCKPPAPDAGGQNKPPASHAVNPLRLTQGDPFPLSGREDSLGADAPAVADHTKLTTYEIDAAFDEWYALYPRRRKPLDAKKAYTSCIRRKGATPAQLLTALKTYRFNPDAQYVPYPATWLNAGSWMEVSATPAVVSTEPTTSPPDRDDRSGRLHTAIEKRFGAAVYGSWFKSLRVEKLDGDKLTVSVATDFQRTWIEEKYRDAMIEVAGALGTVRFLAVVVRRSSP